MERKLELKDIAGYLPYKLWVNVYEKELTGDTGDYCCGGEIEAIAGKKASYDEQERYVNIYKVDYRWTTEYFITKPILRPLADLYHTITHNGKEIVPIVELAKIAQPDIEWYFDHNRAYCNGGYAEFVYDSINHCFRQWSYGMEKHTHNQYQLFDYLNELKIDYRGLIGGGRAIDCNTLDINTYE